MLLFVAATCNTYALVTSELSVVGDDQAGLGLLLSNLKLQQAGEQEHITLHLHPEKLGTLLLGN